MFFFQFQRSSQKSYFLSFLNIVAFYRHSVLIVFEILYFFPILQFSTFQLHEAPIYNKVQGRQSPLYIIRCRFCRGKKAEKGENGRVRSPIWGQFYKKHKKISLFLKKNAQKLAGFENYAYICNMKNLLAGDIPQTTRTEWRQKATAFKNNKNLVVIKNHTIYKNNKITFLRGPLRKNEELF